jgi:hypothetical protein
MRRKASKIAAAAAASFRPYQVASQAKELQIRRSILTRLAEAGMPVSSNPPFVKGEIHGSEHEREPGN